MPLSPHLYGPSLVGWIFWVQTVTWCGDIDEFDEIGVYGGSKHRVHRLRLVESALYVKRGGQGRPISFREQGWLLTLCSLELLLPVVTPTIVEQYGAAWTHPDG